MGSRHHAENTAFDCQACILKGIFLLPNKLKIKVFFFLYCIQEKNYLKVHEWTWLSFLISLNDS